MLLHSCPTISKGLVRSRAASRLVISAPNCSRWTGPSKRCLIKAGAAADVAADLGGDSHQEAALVVQPELTEAQIAARREFLMKDLTQTLRDDLGNMFRTGQITTSRYDRNIIFEDPLTSIKGVELYKLLIQALRTFNTELTVHTMDIMGEDTIVARWSMDMKAWMLPWQPTITFTGTSTYLVDLDTGLVVSHVDTWDAIKHQGFVSLEGLIYVMRQALTVQLTPRLESYKYSVLKKTAEYEVRQYEDFLVASTSTGTTAGPASGAGFVVLADYIFGANKQAVKMDMTTPVLTAVTPQQQSVQMEFVMENRYNDVVQLPEPSDDRVGQRGVKLNYTAAVRFSGWPLDHEVVAAEQGLRAALIRDGLNPAPGYRLARYNEPTVPPFLRRNEVIIQLEGFSWP